MLETNNSGLIKRWAETYGTTEVGLDDIIALMHEDAWNLPRRKDGSVARFSVAQKLGKLHGHLVGHYQITRWRAGVYRLMEMEGGDLTDPIPGAPSGPSLAARLTRIDLVRRWAEKYGEEEVNIHDITALMPENSWPFRYGNNGRVSPRSVGRKLIKLQAKTIEGYQIILRRRSGHHASAYRLLKIAPSSG